MAEYINEKDSLNTGREKINKSIQDSEDAKNIANDADVKSDQALSNSESTQEQLNQVVIEGDSSVEAAQARVDADGANYDTLKDRLDTEHTQVTSQLADVATQLDGLEINVTTVGVYPDDGVDHTDKIRNLIASGVSLVFPSGKYIISDELLFKHGQSIRCVGKVIFDGTDFIGTNGNSIVKVINEGSDYSALPTLTHDVEKETQELNFSTDHNLEIGDIICLYDDTDYSWSSSRNYYKKGEYCRVSSIISNTTVLLDSCTFDSYDATTNTNFGAYKMNMGNFGITGNLQIIQGKTGSTYGLNILRVKDFDASNVVVYAKGSYASVCFEQCFNISFFGTGINRELSGNNTDYGLAIVNCQHVKSDGYFSAPRHGITITSKNGVGAVVDRDIRCYGVVKTEATGTLGTTAFNAHGNTELYSFEGTVYGGVSLGGQSSKIKGTVYGDKDGLCVYFSEITAFEHDFSGSIFKTLRNPNTHSRGVIDLGGNSTPEADNAKGGLMNLSNIVIDAPNAEKGVTIRTRNTTILTEANIDIDLSNSKIIISEEVGLWSIQIEQETGSKDFRLLNATNLFYPNGELRVTSNVQDYQLPKQKGSTEYTTSTEASYISVLVEFEKPYPTNYKPTVNVALNLGQISGVEIVGKITDITNTYFRYRVLTLDGSNFGSATTEKILWSVE